jgi:hypothetical protein
MAPDEDGPTDIEHEVGVFNGNQASGSEWRLIPLRRGNPYSGTPLMGLPASLPDKQMKEDLY